MSSGFAEHLAKLTDTELAELLESRPDARTVPAPGTFEHLAQRLSSADSLTRAFVELDGDAIVVSRAIAALAPDATTQRIGAVVEGAGTCSRPRSAGCEPRAWPGRRTRPTTSPRRCRTTGVRRSERAGRSPDSPPPRTPTTCVPPPSRSGSRPALGRPTS